jgi:hypothetical protein
MARAAVPTASPYGDERGRIAADAASPMTPASQSCRRTGTHDATHACLRESP